MNACMTGGGGGGSGGGNSKWKLGFHKSAQKWANRMAKRGWITDQIDEAIEHGQQFSAPNNVNPGNGATRFVNPSTGRSVVVDNVTGDILHVGGDGYLY
jgi:Colicin E5 ribonuclease domain